MYFSCRSLRLVRQWKRKTDSMTEATIKQKFHMADINGDGRLNPKEFMKLLKSFGMDLSPADVEILIARFDVDNDGDIDLNEFRAFIESEQKNLSDATASTAGALASSALPPPKGRTYQRGSGSGGGSVDDSTLLPLRPRSSSTSHSRPQTATSATQPRHNLNKTTSDGTPHRPASAPRSRTNLNVTAPGGIESSPDRQLLRPLGRSVTIQSPRTGNISSNTERGNGSSDGSGDGTKSGIALRTDEGVGVGVGNDGEVLGEEVDLLWVSRMLQAQAEVEARIGRRYYC